MIILDSATGDVVAEIDEKFNIVSCSDLALIESLELWKSEGIVVFAGTGPDGEDIGKNIKLGEDMSVFEDELALIGFEIERD